jgi:hypothetical protein
MVSGMVTFKVQLWPLKDGDGYTEVEADTSKEAAEQLYGEALNYGLGFGTDPAISGISMLPHRSRRFQQTMS